jgi:cytochrome c
MKSVAIALAAATALTYGLVARAADAGEDLAKSSGCLACHTVDKKLIGPSYRDIANKYRGDKGRGRKPREKSERRRQGRVGRHPDDAQRARQGCGHQHDRRLDTLAEVAGVEIQDSEDERAIQIPAESWGLFD